MSKKLFLGNLSFKAEEADLKEAFSKFGEVTEVAIIKDKFSGRSKGFGFITFADDAAANAAIAEMNEKPFQDRNLIVNEAKPMEPRSSSDRPRRSFDGGDRRSSYGGERRSFSRDRY